MAYYAAAAVQRQRVAHRPGTNTGRASAVNLFIGFCRSIPVSHRRASYIHFCWYIEYLAKYHYSAGAISNNISHLRTYFRMAGLDITPLMHYRVQLALRAVAMTIRQQSNTKLPVTPLSLKRVLPFIRSQPDALPVSLGLLIMFMGFLRQSSVAPPPPSCTAFDYTRHLTQADASLSTAGLAITIKWSKTIQRAADLKTVLLPATSDPDL